MGKSSWNRRRPRKWKRIISKDSSTTETNLDIPSHSEITMTDTSDTSASSKRLSVGRKELRVVLQNIAYTDLISAEQQQELFNRSFKPNTTHDSSIDSLSCTEIKKESSLQLRKNKYKSTGFSSASTWKYIDNCNLSTPCKTLTGTIRKTRFCKQERIKREPSMGNSSDDSCVIVSVRRSKRLNSAINQSSERRSIHPRLCKDVAIKSQENTHLSDYYGTRNEGTNNTPRIRIKKENSLTPTFSNFRYENKKNVFNTKIKKEVDFASQDMVIKTEYDEATLVPEIKKENIYLTSDPDDFQVEQRKKIKKIKITERDFDKLSPCSVKRRSRNRNKYQCRKKEVVSKKYNAQTGNQSVTATDENTLLLLNKDIQHKIKADLSTNKITQGTESPDVKKPKTAVNDSFPAESSADVTNIGSRFDNFYSQTNADLRSQDFSNQQPVADSTSCNKQIGMKSSMPSYIDMAIEATANVQPIIFIPSQTDFGATLEKDHYSLDMIAATIEKDCAAGNRFPQIGDDIAINSAISLGDTYSFSDLTSVVSIVDDLEGKRNDQTALTIESRDVQNTGKPVVSDAASPTRLLNGGNKEKNAVKTPISDSDSIISLSGRKRKLPTIIRQEILSDDSISQVLKNVLGSNKRKKRNEINFSDVGVDEGKDFITPDANGTINSNRTISKTEGKLLYEVQVLTENSGIGITEAQQNNITNNTAIVGYEDALNNNKAYDSIAMLLQDYNSLVKSPEKSGDVESTAVENIESTAEFSNVKSDQVDKALQYFADKVAAGKSTTSEKLEDNRCVEQKPIAKLTVENLDQFNTLVSRGNHHNVRKISMPPVLMDNESIKEVERQSQSTTSSANLRKRTWNPVRQESKSLNEQKGKIRLNRKRLSSDKTLTHASTDERCISPPVSKHSMPAKPEIRPTEINLEPVEVPRTKLQNKEGDTVDYSQEVIGKIPVKNDQGSINSCSTNKTVQNYNKNVRKAVPVFGAPSIYEGAAPDTPSSSTDSSSSSSSSTGSPTSSSSRSASNSSSETNSSATDTKGNKSSCSSHSTKKSSSPKSKKRKASVDLEKSTEPNKTAGSLKNDDKNDDEEKDGDKNDKEEDCISLFADSLILSGGESPSPYDLPKKCSSICTEQYKQMKSENIDSFVKANKRECEEKLKEAYSNHDNTTEVVFETPSKRTPLVDPNVENNTFEALALSSTNVLGIQSNRDLPDLRLTLHGITQREIQKLFWGQCFRWLNNGSCIQPSCRYRHCLKSQLQDIHKHNYKSIYAILSYCVTSRYRYYVTLVLRNVMTKMTALQVITLCKDFYTRKFMINSDIELAVDVLSERGLKLLEIVSYFNEFLSELDVDLPMHLMRVIHNKLEPGSFWETLEKLISRFSPPIWIIESVLKECISQKRTIAHAAEVHDKMLKNLPAEVMGKIRESLLKKFYDLVKTDVTSDANKTTVQPPQPVGMPQPVCSIASPDSPKQSNDIASAVQPDSAITSMAVVTLNLPDEERPSCSTKQKTPSPLASTANRSCTSLENENSYHPSEIDNVAPPRSHYSDWLWKFHLDLHGVQEGLKHKDYKYVIFVLKKNLKNMNRLPYIAGFYRILCKEIMSSNQHLSEIVQLTVQSGAPDVLRRFVFELGVYILTKLADIGAWIRAYELLKTFKVYGTYNTCAFTLLSAEIYIANHRPLKALALLKQSQLIFMNSRMWNQLSCSDDAILRVSVIDSLLRALCNGYGDYAVALIEFILNDQCNSFKPINVDQHLDRMVQVLLSEERTDSVMDIARLILEHHLIVSPGLFRALINHVFHNDEILAKQLHRYSTWLGVYNTSKISGTSYVIVDISWTEEELYLMLVRFMEDLAVNIGHAIGRLRPRQLAVYVVIEKRPTEQDLYSDIKYLANGRSKETSLMTAVRKQKGLLKDVLERFDPKVKLIQRTTGRLCKLQSNSLMHYLKSGHL